MSVCVCHRSCLVHNAAASLIQQGQIRQRQTWLKTRTVMNGNRQRACVFKCVYLYVCRISGLFEVNPVH